MIAYCLQIACLVALAEALLRIVPVASAGFRYAYWRLALAGALVAPWLVRPPVEEWAGGSMPAALPIIPAASISPATEVVAVATARTDWWPLVFWSIAAGIAARVVWVACGLLRLRALRRRGRPLTDAVADEVQETIGTRAEIQEVAALAQPVTFGIRRPVVLVPEGLSDLAEGVRRAALTHELLHVQRRDWAWVLGEEALRALFWFHPAVWWATSRIRLTREEFTDHLAVLTIGGRRAYVDALLAFADSTRIEPAPAFARRADLFHRIVLLTKEPAMTARRIVASGIALAALLTAGGVLAAAAFPLPSSVARPVPAAAPVQAASAQAASPDANRVTPENPIPRRIYAVPISYPVDMRGTGVGAALSLQVVVDAAGVPVSVVLGSGAMTNVDREWLAAQGAASNSRFPAVRTTMESFRAAAADAIMQWRYDPPAQAPLTFWVGVTFAADADGVVSQSGEAIGVSASNNEVRLGPPPVPVAYPPVARTVPGTGVVGRGRGVAGAVSGTVAGVPEVPTAVESPAPGVPVRVGTVTASEQVIYDADGNPRVVPVRRLTPVPVQLTKVNPAYPPIARSARVQGLVILELTIDEQGLVSEARVLRSIPLLDQAALDAVRQWRYAPTLVNGVPTPIVTTVTVPFILDEQPVAAPPQAF